MEEVFAANVVNALVKMHSIGIILIQGIFIAVGNIGGSLVLLLMKIGRKGLGYFQRSTSMYINKL